MGDWDYLDEMPHRKVRQKRKPKKSNHQHNYHPILVYSPDSAIWSGSDKATFNYFLARRCVVCGKVIGTWTSYTREFSGLYRRIGFPRHKPVDLELTHDVYQTDFLLPMFSDIDDLRLIRKAKV